MGLTVNNRHTKRPSILIRIATKKRSISLPFRLYFNSCVGSLILQPMALHRQPQPDGGDRLLKSKGNASFKFTTPIPYRHATQVKGLRNLPEDAESDSKSVQVPSLLADDSSRASSINNLEYRSEADDSGRWLLHGDGLDEHTAVLRRSGSPTSMEELNLNR